VLGFYPTGPVSKVKLDLLAAAGRLQRATELSLRAKAVEHGLDPSTTLPEDIALLEIDDKGQLEVKKEFDRAMSRMVEEENAAGTA
jgi:hypothetical protein